MKRKEEEREYKKSGERVKSANQIRAMNKRKKAAKLNNFF